jgi:branched-chain amino acid transport system substrate-binding protein
MHRTQRGGWRIAGLVVAAAVTLAACGSSKKNDVSTSNSNSKTGGVTCSGLAIGFFGALTGDSANLGINERNGAKLAIQQFNTANPNCQVQLKEFDSAGDPAQAPALAQKAVQDNAVVALVGPAFSGESKVADPIFDEAGLPLITASATNPSLSTHGWKVFHRAVGNDNSQGPAAAKYMIDTVKAKKIAVLDDASEYGKGIADIVRTKVKDGGATVADSESIDPKGTDFSSSVTKIKAAGADAVFFGGYYQAAGVLAKQLKDGGVNATFVAPDGSNDKGFVSAAGNAAEGAILLAPAAPIAQVQGGDKFQSDYKAAIGSDIGLYSVEAYDAANAELEAIKNGSTTRKAINDYLNTKLDYKGLSKTLKFDDKGELAGAVTIYAYQVKSGVITGLTAVAAS